MLQAHASSIAATMMPSWTHATAQQFERTSKGAASSDSHNAPSGGLQQSRRHSRHGLLQKHHGDLRTPRMQTWARLPCPSSRPWRTCRSGRRCPPAPSVAHQTANCRHRRGCPLLRGPLLLRDAAGLRNGRWLPACTKASAAQSWSCEELTATMKVCKCGHWGTKRHGSRAGLAGGQPAQ